VRRFYQEVFVQGNLAAADEILAPDFQNHVPGGPVLGAAEQKQFAAMTKRAFADQQVEVEDQLTEGDKLLTRWRISGTHTGVFSAPRLGHYEPTGRRFTVSPDKEDSASVYHGPQPTGGGEQG
jgi:hypothetical protein